MFNPVVSKRTVALVLTAEVAALVVGSWLWHGMPGWRTGEGPPSITIRMKNGPRPLSRTYSL